MPLVLGVDSSTSACKVELRDLDTGDVVASGRAPHPPTQPPRSEQDPRTWLDAFASACQQAGIGNHELHPAAVAIAGQQHGMVVLGEDGQPLRPAKLWNDTESAPDAAELIDELPGGRAGWANAVGSVPVASFTITKLRWLRRCEPETFRRVESVLLPHDWLTSQLTGRRSTDRGDASGTGYWSPAEERYRLDLLALVDDSVEWENRLPEVLGPTEVAGLWAVHDALVAAGTGDNMAAALGLGMGPGDIAISLGTSGTVFAVTEEPHADASGAIAGFADGTGRFLPLVCTLNATKVTDAVGRLLGVDHEEFDTLVLGSDPGAAGVVLIPHLDGERTPDRPNATGTLTGLRADVTRAQVARAAVEGVVANLLLGAGPLLEESARLAGRVLLVGGGARSRAYRQVVADLVGRPVVVPHSTETVVTGAAVQAAAVFAGRPFDQVAADWGLREGQVIEPDSRVDGAAIRDAVRAAIEATGHNQIRHESH